MDSRRKYEQLFRRDLSGMDGEEVESYVRELEDTLHSDHLTGLLNKRAFDRILEYEMKRSRVYNTPFSLAMFDADRFGEIDKQKSHEVADEELVQFANYVRANARTEDTFFRRSGDEFYTLMPGTGKEGSIEAIRRFLGGCNQTVELPSGKIIPITFGFGINTCRADDIEPQNFIEETNRAMNKAKKHPGKQDGKHRIYHTDTEEVITVPPF